MEHLTETLQESRTETKCNPIIDSTKTKIQLLTLDRPRTKQERLDYLAFRAKQNDYVVSKPKRIHTNYTKAPSKVRVKPKKSSGRIKLGDGKTTNTEHLNPRARGGSNNRKNLKKSDIVYHDHKHGYFGNKLLSEQLDQVIDDNYEVMYKETRHIITKAIKHIIKYFVDKKQFYDPDTFKSPHFIP